MIDLKNLWINTRFRPDCGNGLRQDLPASIALRSCAGKGVSGRAARVEVLADAVTEENLAKVEFDALPEPSPPIGKLAEVSVACLSSPQ